MDWQDRLTWGEWLNVAYRRQKDRTGRAHREIAELVAPYHTGNVATTETALSRLEKRDEAPKSGSSRKLAFFALLAYGYDPAEFGINEDSVALAGIDVNQVRDLLLRASNRNPISPEYATCKTRAVA